jgi:hypothetical protein
MTRTFELLSSSLKEQEEVHIDIVTVLLFFHRLVTAGGGTSFCCTTVFLPCRAGLSLRPIDTPRTCVRACDHSKQYSSKPVGGGRAGAGQSLMRAALVSGRNGSMMMMVDRSRRKTTRCTTLPVRQLRPLPRPLGRLDDDARWTTCHRRPSWLAGEC